MITTVISLCDYSGAWARPWLPYRRVILVDPKHREGLHYERELSNGRWDYNHQGVRGVWTIGATAAEFFDELAKIKMGEFDGDTLLGQLVQDVEVVLAAPPCTHFAVSGAQYWKAKDADGRTAEAVQVVEDCLDIIDLVQPRVWAIENPVGRLEKLVPRIAQAPVKQYVHPHNFARLAHGEAYTKKTGLWGNFEPLNTEKWNVEPERVCAQGSWVQKLGGPSERTKELRSKTPDGLAQAFFLHNL